VLSLGLQKVRIERREEEGGGRRPLRAKKWNRGNLWMEMEKC
jgi:hypothetical protein